MPPASRGSIFNAFRNVFRTSQFRQCPSQRRFATKLPPKSALPDESVIKAAIKRRAKAKEALAVQENGAYKLPGKVLSRIPLPPPVRAVLTKASPHLSWLARWIWRLFLFGPPVTLAIMLFPVTIMRVQGESMAPLLNVNSSRDEPAPSPDQVIVRKVRIPEVLARVFGEPRVKLERGQVVVYYAPHNPNTFVIKRVIALPGDRVQPLEGYPGGVEKPVIIPYNHIWVEGDANSRKKSVDSNQFGPISQNMIHGFVLGVYSPWSKWPVWLKWEDDDYPAKNSGRVEKDVVRNAKLHPDEAVKRSQDPFKDGTAALELALIRRSRYLMPQKIRNKDALQYYRHLYSKAKSEAGNGDAGTREVAGGLVDELECVFESVGLSKDGSRLAPVVEAQKDEEDAAIKKRRLEEYLAKHRRPAESSTRETYSPSSG